MSLTKYDIAEIKADYHNSFINAKQSDELMRKKLRKSFHENFSGKEVREFYEGIISEPSKNKQTKTGKQNDNISLTTIQSNSHCNKKPNMKVLHNLKINFLKYSADGDIEKVKDIINMYRNEPFYFDILNYQDQYGWNALCCAAAESHYELIDILIEESITLDLFLLQDICSKRSQEDVMQHILTQRKTKQRPSTKRSFKIITDSREQVTNCDICGEKYLVSQKQKHESSTIHIFKDSSSIKTMYAISERNKGYQMMLQKGWETDKGLGIHGEGRKNPIKTKLKNNRYGLGMEKNAIKKVTHFSANDTHSIKSKLVTKDNSTCSKIKFINRKTIEKRKKREKVWEENMRRYLSSDF